MITKKKIASIIATTAAIAFATAPLTSTLVNASSHKVKCYGVNSCKGKHNSCKGKGYKMETVAKCKKLGGSTEEPSSSPSEPSSTPAEPTSTPSTSGS